MSAGHGVEQRDAVPGPGALVAGKYRVERTIGAGGMGVVVAARHTELNHLVAIKFLNEKTASGTGKARFMREARASAALRSEHVARVFDVGTLESGAPFMVMEYLEGESLSKLIRNHAPLAVHQALDFILQACDALGEAHEHGIVHRDVKPSNLFLTKRNDGSTLVKVLDFGISTAPTRVDEAELTESSTVLGSPQYLSPEQIVDVRRVDQRSDVWALGVVLYYMLAGARPFEEETVAALCVAIATKTPTRLIDHRPDIPRELDAVVMRCLEKNREQRIASVADLQRELTPFVWVAMSSYAPPSVSTLAPLDLALPEAPPDLIVPPRDSQNSISAVQTGPRSTATRLPIVALVALGALLVLFFVTRGQQEAGDELGDVVGSPAEPATDGPASAAPIETTIRVPGSVKPPTPPPSATAEAKKPKLPDGVDGPFITGRSVAKLTLRDRLGGGEVMGTVPAGEGVLIRRVSGRWALVSYSNNRGGVISGWTLRRLVE